VAVLQHTKDAPETGRRAIQRRNQTRFKWQAIVGVSWVYSHRSVNKIVNRFYAADELHWPAKVYGACRIDRKQALAELVEQNTLIVRRGLNIHFLKKRLKSREKIEKSAGK